MRTRPLSRSLITLGFACALWSGCSDDKDPETSDGAVEPADAASAEDAARADADVSEDAGSSNDASTDAGGSMDSGTEAGLDASPDAGLDAASVDAGDDASVDAGADTGAEASADAALDGGDAATDASHSDAATDAGNDAGAGDSGVGVTFCPGEAQGCSLASDVCCLGSGCVDKAVGCGDAGASLRCDGPEDCTGSTPLCCASGQGLTCSATCGAPVCNGDDDCDEGDSCLQLGGSGVGFCVPAPTGGSCTPACPATQRCLFGTCIPAFDGGFPFPFPFEGGVGP